MIRDFLNVTRDAQDWLAENGYSSENESVEALLKFRLDAAAAAERMRIDLENIEDLFSLATATPDAPQVEHIIRSVAATIEYASRNRTEPIHHLFTKKSEPASTPRNWIAVGDSLVDRRTFHVPAYDFACGILADHFGDRVYEHSTFITLNYDMVLETAFERLGIPYSLGLPSSALLDLRKNARPSTSSEVLLLKLHGSICWGRSSEDTRIRILDRYDDLRAAGLVPILVPPTWKKQSEDALWHLWLKAIEALRTASRIIVVGYSFPEADQNMKYLLLSGLMRNNVLRKIIVWDTADPRKVEARLFQLFRPELREKGMIDVRNAGIVSAFDSADTRREIDRFLKPPFRDD